MIVSWNWLQQYVPLTMSPREFEQRLMMAGLNHEETHEVGDDLAIDLEVTSNRPDCLGHIGIAREVSVLWNSVLTLPAARPAEGVTRVEDLVRVRIECPDLCPRYTARVVRGVRIAPSPAWLTRRLATVGVAAINNVVDVSNYVMMECGQPLHTFDYGKLAAGAGKGVSHRLYEVPGGPFRQTVADTFPDRRLSSAAPCSARPSRPSTTRPIASKSTSARSPTLGRRWPLRA